MGRYWCQNWDHISLYWSRILSCGLSILLCWSGILWKSHFMMVVSFQDGGVILWRSHFLLVLPMNPFRQEQYIKRAFAFLHLTLWSKMAGDRADNTKRLLRQCAAGLLSAYHRLERVETESTVPSLQTSANVINPPPHLDCSFASWSQTAIQELQSIIFLEKASTKAVKRKQPGCGNKVPYIIRSDWDSLHDKTFPI